MEFSELDTNRDNRVVAKIAPHIDFNLRLRFRASEYSIKHNRLLGNFLEILFFPDPVPRVWFEPCEWIFRVIFPPRTLALRNMTVG